MRTLALLVAIAAAMPLAGQAASEAITVQVVEIEAVVIDGTGAPVENLQRDDFDVRVNGKPAEVTNFHRVERGVAGGGSRATGEAQAVPSRLIVFIDDLHLLAGSKKRALDALRRYAETSISDATKPILIRWNGSMSSMKPARDKEALLREIARIEREPVRSTRAAAERQRVLRQINDVLDIPGPNADERAQYAMMAAVQYAAERHRDAHVTLEALKELVTLVSSFPERKVLLYVSDGLPLRAGTETLQYARDALRGFDLLGGFLSGAQPLDDQQYDLTAAYRGLVQYAQAADVVVSVLDPGGLRGYAHSAVESAGGHARLDSTAIRENESNGLRMVAFQTGGRYVGQENDLDRAISLLAGDVSTYYSLGVRGADSARFDVDVRVRGREDLRVLTARRRELATEAEILAATLRARLYSRVEENPLGATLKVLPPTKEGGKCAVPAEVILPPERLGRMKSSSVPRVDLEIHAMAVDDRHNESAIRSSRKQLTPKEGEPLVEPIAFGFQVRKFVVSLAIVDMVSGTTSYLQADVDASACIP